MKGYTVVKCKYCGRQELAGEMKRLAGHTMCRKCRRADYGALRYSYPWDNPKAMVTIQTNYGYHMK